MEDIEKLKKEKTNYPISCIISYILLIILAAIMIYDHFA